MKVGAIPFTGAASRVQEFYIQQNVAATLPGGGVWYQYYVGQFVMPFTGALIVSSWAKFKYTGADSFIQVRMSNQYVQIAPSSAPAGVWQDGIPGSTFGEIVDIPYVTTWNSVPAGQLMSLHAEVTCQILVPYFEWNLSLVRCIRS